MCLPLKITTLLRELGWDWGLKDYFRKIPIGGEYLTMIL